MFHGHVLGHLVRSLRLMASRGALPNEILKHLREHCGPDEHLQYEYLNAAFQPGGAGSTFRFVVPPFDYLGDEAEARVAKLITQDRPDWEAQRFPELIRIRDYLSFLEFAKDENIIVTVCSANPLTSVFVGRSGYRCYDGRVPVVSAEVGPGRGLIAVDPREARLADMLDRFVPSLTYDQYLDRLRELGYRVEGPETGHLLVDANGVRQYEGYRLHGAYDADRGTPAWTGKRGEKLRADLNRRLGEELIHYGPHDDWEHRNDPAVAGPLFGPQLPAIAFQPDHELSNLLTVDDMGWAIPEINQNWHRLYPHHPVQQ